MREKMTEIETFLSDSFLETHVVAQVSILSCGHLSGVTTTNSPLPIKRLILPFASLAIGSEDSFHLIHHHLLLDI